MFQLKLLFFVVLFFKYVFNLLYIDTEFHWSNTHKIKVGCMRPSVLNEFDIPGLIYYPGHKCDVCLKLILLLMATGSEFCVCHKKFGALSWKALSDTL